MSGSNGQTCPECGAPRRPDGTPSCACTRRASDALRDARTAQAAAAEDFDPLRIRPYVDLPVTTTGAEAPTAPEPAPQDATPDATVRLPAVPAEMPDRHSPALLEAPGQDATTRLEAVPDGPEAFAPSGAARSRHRRRRRHTTLLAAAGAVVTVAAAAAFAGGLFSYDPPQRDGALPKDIRESVPEKSPSREPSSAAPTASASAPVPSATASRSVGPTSSASPSSASPSPSAPAAPSASRTTATPTGSASPTATDDRTRPGARLLQNGDSGPEVTELQLRLRQLNLYSGPANGQYNRKVENSVRTYQLARGITQDEPGVYGTATRARLESETSAP
ncbi:peptidoglycan-binding protein [Streptomyces colonosanans]|uniref:Peptidoglycan binding-like domain-containing protein n=1 Tax=Streptomyces colonosanans TaxID=1428652 RepID=A0A1S2NY97_9ACTN|nr:peptidoglycan-binding protein [Streptomyces colonosanans]OIJ86175.1 hypothetical protein BIV24_27035 [Streptomyces colonosanans]